MVSIDEIKRIFRGKILVQEPLSNYTTMRIGGPADLLLIPEDKNDAVNLLTYLQENNIEFLIIGKGSNILVSDEGVRGLVINFAHGLNQLRLENEYIYVETGVIMSRFVDFCIQNRRQGFEKLAGIPGTVGGALVMNAGAYGCQISDYLVGVEVIRNGVLIDISKEKLQFSYRNSSLTNEILVSAKFYLTSGDISEMQKTRAEYLRKRNLVQPLNYPNMGSVFKNPPNNYAAKLIEQAELKGLQIGDAKVSEKHGNFIVNLGNAKALDVIQLINKIRKTVYEKFKIVLEPEIKFIGFKHQLLVEL